MRTNEKQMQIFIFAGSLTICNVITLIIPNKRDENCVWLHLHHETSTKNKVYAHKICTHARMHACGCEKEREHTSLETFN